MKAPDTTILRIVKVIIDKLGVDQNFLSYKTSFANDLGADSLDIYELIMAIEKEFELTIKDDDAEKLTTVGAVIEYIEDKLSKPVKHKPKPEQHQVEIIIINKLKEEIANKNLVKVSRV